MNKKLFLSLVFLSIGTLAFTQNAVVTNAILYHKDKDLTNAKKEIDKAVVNEKTKADPKAWYYKGVIYSEISRSEAPELKADGTDYLKEAIDALEKAKQFDASKGEYYKLSDAKEQELWPDVINKAVSEYEAEKLKQAQSYFELAQHMKPEDTTGYVYGSYAAESLNDMVSLKKYTEKLVSLNHKTPYVYRNWINVENDKAKKLEIAKSAVNAFPSDQALAETLADLYSEEGKNKEAIETYQTLESRVPNNVTILLKTALQYQKLKDNEKALEYYEKVVKNDPANFLAHYNSAVIYFEKGKAENEAIHKLTVSDYQHKGKQLEEEMNKTFDSAVNHANSAKLLTKDEADLNNIKLIISEVDKVRKK